MLALEKILSSFITLPGLLWVIWLIITIHLFKKGKSSIYIISLVSLILLYIFISAIGTGILVEPLENMYIEGLQIEEFDRGHPIVVLGGGINYREDTAYLSAYSLQRLIKGFDIYQKIGGPIIFTGGVAIGQKEISESEIAIKRLMDMGVRQRDIVIESEARTTYENGIYVRRWLRDYNYDLSLEMEQSNSSLSDSDINNRVYLVTSALHMPRSVMVFEKQGIEVIPVSSGIVADHQPSWLEYLPNSQSLSANMMAVHEWIGLFW
ncbi:MAG: YdcF family protein, partial [Halanaerobiales bacterium]